MLPPVAEIVQRLMRLTQLAIRPCVQRDVGSIVG